MKKLLSDKNGIKTTMEVNSDKTTVSKTQDVEGLLNLNKIRSNVMGKKINDDAYNHVASIPATLIVKWLQEEGLDIYNPDHAHRLKLKLNDPEYMYLRTSELVI